MPAPLWAALTEFQAVKRRAGQLRGESAALVGRAFVEGLDPGAGRPRRTRAMGSSERTRWANRARRRGRQIEKLAAVAAVETAAT